jgi:hypothetical protein
MRRRYCCIPAHCAVPWTSLGDDAAILAYATPHGGLRPNLGYALEVAGRRILLTSDEQVYCLDGVPDLGAADVLCLNL